MGPLVFPSHSGQPIEQPLENQRRLGGSRDLAIRSNKGRALRHRAPGVHARDGAWDRAGPGWQGAVNLRTWRGCCPPCSLEADVPQHHGPTPGGGTTPAPPSTSPSPTLLPHLICLMVDYKDDPSIILFLSCFIYIQGEFFS